MSEPTAETTERIREAAKLRVEGMSWERVAQHFRYANADAARVTLTQAHPELWRAEYERARELYLDDMEAEAILTQRALMRPFRSVRKPDGSEIVQTIEPQLNQSAAHSILSHAARLRAQKIEVKGEVRHSGHITPMTPEEAIAALREAHERHQALHAEGGQTHQTDDEQAASSSAPEAPEGDPA
jgi:hypothetical protein